jgi:hypothetical protein
VPPITGIAGNLIFLNFVFMPFSMAMDGKKNGPSRFEEGPCEFEPTTLEGIIGKLRV